MARVVSEVGRRLVLETFSKQALAIQVGASVEKIDFGQVWIKFPRHPLTTQHHGYFHGGVVSYLADIAGGLAGFTHFTQEGYSSLTIELKINFLKAAQGAFLLGKGQVVQ
jgi:uncharacterized protein (TIGR00369 family)